MVRGTSLTNFSAVVADLGGDPTKLLLDAGIQPDYVGRQDVFLKIRAVGRLLDSSALCTGTPDFGRRLASRQGIEILGPVGVAAHTAASVADALAVFERFLSAYSPALKLSVHTPVADEAFVEFQIAEPGLAPGERAQGFELSLGVLLQVLRFLLGARYAPLSVHVPHPALTSPDAYAIDYGCPAQFGQAKAGFTVRAADLASPLHRDEITHDIITRYLTDVTADRLQLSQSVRALIRQLLPGGVVGVDAVAEHLETHPKVLQRRLADEGTTFRALIDEVRRTTAQTMLADTSISLADLTHQLGYTEHSTFTRACRRWFGCGPSAHRIALTRAEPAQATMGR